MARFSLIVPATRPRLLPFALRSIKAQDFRDYEVIVSDNGATPSLDVFNTYADQRMRYVRPAERLNVVDHWDFAFTQATGDIQLMVNDDDAIAPNLLSILDREFARDPGIKTVSWGYAGFSDGSHWEPESRNRFLIAEQSGKREAFDAKQLLNAMFASGSGKFGGVKQYLPFLPMSAYRRDLIADIRTGLAGRMFLPLCPMTSCCLAALTTLERHVRINLVLTVFGETVDSAAGHTADATTLTKMFVGTGYQHAPIKLMSVFPSTAAESILRVQAAMPEKLGHYQLNLENYYRACYFAIEDMRQRGTNVEVELREFFAAVDREPGALRDKIHADPFFATHNRPQPPRPVYGHTGLIENIFEAALYCGVLAERARHNLSA